MGCRRPRARKMRAVGHPVEQRDRHIVVRYDIAPSWGITCVQVFVAPTPRDARGGTAAVPRTPPCHGHLPVVIVPTVHVSSCSFDPMSRSRPHDLDEEWSGQCTFPGAEDGERHVLRGDCFARPPATGREPSAFEGAPSDDRQGARRVRGIASRLRPPRPSAL